MPIARSDGIAPPSAGRQPLAHLGRDNAREVEREFIALFAAGRGDEQLELQ